MTQPRIEQAAKEALMREMQCSYLASHCLPEATMEYAPVEEAVVLRVDGAIFARRFDLSEDDPQKLAASVDEQMCAFVQYARRKYRRTPRCYLPRPELPDREEKQ